MFLVSAFGALPLDNERYGVRVKARGGAFALFLAHFVVQHTSAVFEGMYHTVLQKKCERAEYARLV